MSSMNEIEEEYLKENLPEFSPGDTVKVYYRIKEGEKERTQIFEGVVISKRGDGTRETFTVRKLSFGIGIERIFPINSPKIEKIEVVKEGRARRNKLYFLRGLSSKRMKKKVSTKK